MSENSDNEKMSIAELQKKGRRKIKKNSEKKVIEIDGFLDQISKDLKSCSWQNQGNQVPFQLLFDKFPIKISDLPTEVPKGNKTNKSYLVQVGTSRLVCPKLFFCKHLSLVVNKARNMWKISPLLPSKKNLSPEKIDQNTNFAKLPSAKWLFLYNCKFYH